MLSGKPGSVYACSGYKSWLLHLCLNPGFGSKAWALATSPRPLPQPTLKGVVFLSFVFCSHSWMQAKATREAVIAIKGGSQRPFLVSRCACVWVDSCWAAWLASGYSHACSACSSQAADGHKQATWHWLGLHR